MNTFAFAVLDLVCAGAIGWAIGFVLAVGLTCWRDHRSARRHRELQP